MKKLVLSVSLIVMVMIWSTLAFAYYGDTLTDTKHFSLGVTGQNSNQVTSATALLPFKFGWLGLHGARQTADDKIVSETANAHLQGMYNIGAVNLECYVELFRDRIRDIDYAFGSGYFLRPPKVTWNGITFSFGAGNWTERRQNDDEIGRDAADPENRIGWLSFVSGNLVVKGGQLSTIARYKPTIDFDETIWEFSSAFNYPISKEWLLGFTKNAILENEDIHTSYQLVLTYTPGEGE